MLKTDGSVPQMSLFKHKRVKGWWPFHVKNEGEEMELTVYVVFCHCHAFGVQVLEMNLHLSATVSFNHDIVNVSRCAEIEYRP